MQRGTEVGTAAAREWGDNEDNREVRAALNKDLEAFAQLYSHRSKRVYAKIEQGIAPTAWVLSLIAAVAVLLAGAGALMIWRSVAQPLARITRITEAVAAGTERRRSLRRARRRDRRARPLDRGVPGRHAQERGAQPHGHRRRPGARHRQERMSAEISQFSAEVEATDRRARPHLRSDAGGLDPARRRGRQRRAADRGRGHRLGRCVEQCARHRLRPPTSLPPR